MVKYGAHCYILTERWSDNQIDLLHTARELELDYFEIAVGDDVHFTPRLTRQRAHGLGLVLGISPGGEWPAVCDLSADDATNRQKGLNWHKRQVDLGAEMGAVAYTGALYGHPGTVKRRRPPVDEFKWTAEGLHQLAEYGSRRGLEIVLEPMSHFRTHIANTPNQVMRLASMADHPNLRVLLDTYHLITEIRDYGAAIGAAQSKLWGIHACENDRGLPGGGLVPWEKVFSSLHEISFAGYVVFETYNSSIGDFAYQRAMFHHPCPDGKAFISAALAFVRAGLG